MKKTLSLCAITLAALAFASCSQKEIGPEPEPVPTEGKASLKFDWSNLASTAAKPAKMVVYLYPDNGLAPTKCEVNNNVGADIQLRVGKYRVVCFNTDTKNIKIQDEAKKETIFATTGDKTEPTKADPLRWAEEPDMLYSYQTDEIQELKITEDKKGTEPLVITMAPKARVVNYAVKISGYDMTDINEVYAGTFTNMKGGYFLGKDEPTAEHVALSYQLTKGGNGDVTGQTLSFGAFDDSHNLTMYYVWHDGSQWKVAFDATDTMNHPADPANPEVIVDVPSLPTPPVPEPYKPSDWGDVDTDPNVDPWNPGGDHPVES